MGSPDGLSTWLLLLRCRALPRPNTCCQLQIIAGHLSQHCTCRTGGHLGGGSQRLSGQADSYRQEIDTPPQSDLGGELFNLNLLFPSQAEAELFLETDSLGGLQQVEASHVTLDTTILKNNIFFHRNC